MAQRVAAQSDPLHNHNEAGLKKPMLDDVPPERNDLDE